MPRMAGELDPIRRRMREAAEDAVRRTAEDLLGRAQRDAPIEEGTLRGSGTVEIDQDGDSITATVLFATPYAAVQHERIDYSHPMGGKAKYLEDPLKDMAGRYERIIGAAVSRAL